MPRDNSRLLVAPGNQWRKEKEAGPFYGVPAAWRRFVFQVLNSREFAVYAYVCSVMDPNAIAYPTPEQIAEDMGIRTRSVIVDALGILVKRGFLLAGTKPRPGRMSTRTVYQRPLPHYTLKTLLEKDLIDSELFPTRNKVRNDQMTGATDPVVHASLRALLGEQAYSGYMILRDPERRKKVLLTAFTEFVDKSVASKTEELAVEPKVRNYPKRKIVTAAMPAFVRNLIAEEQLNFAEDITTQL